MIEIIGDIGQTVTSNKNDWGRSDNWMDVWREEVVWMVSGGSVDGVWKLSGGCLVGVWRVSGKCLESVWKVSGMCCIAWR